MEDYGWLMAAKALGLNLERPADARRGRGAGMLLSAEPPRSHASGLERQLARARQEGARALEQRAAQRSAAGSPSAGVAKPPPASSAPAGPIEPHDTSWSRRLVDVLYSQQMVQMYKDVKSWDTITRQIAKQMGERTGHYYTENEIQYAVREMVKYAQRAERPFRFIPWDKETTYPGTDFKFVPPKPALQATDTEDAKRMVEILTPEFIRENYRNPKAIEQIAQQLRPQLEHRIGRPLLESEYRWAVQTAMERLGKNDPRFMGYYPGDRVQFWGFEFYAPSEETGDVPPPLTGREKEVVTYGKPTAVRKPIPRPNTRKSSPNPSKQAGGKR